jgi:hypothetical protein
MAVAFTVLEGLLKVRLKATLEGSLQPVGEPSMATTLKARLKAG